MSLPLTEVADMHKITISSGGMRVQAPLPEDFGLTIGSSYTTLFDVGNLNSSLSKIAAFGGVSQKVGVAMKRMFTNPEPSEISFNMEFSAYRDAYSEVVAPVIALLNIAAPTRLKGDEAAPILAEMLAAAGERAQAIADNMPSSTSGAIMAEGLMAGGSGLLAVGDAVENYMNPTTTAGALAATAMNLIGFIRGPDKATIMFGNVFTLTGAFLSSVGFQFSNVLDHNGFPMKATASVTVVLEDVPVKESINRWFA